MEGVKIVPCDLGIYLSKNCQKKLDKLASLKERQKAKDKLKREKKQSLPPQELEADHVPKKELKALQKERARQSLIDGQKIAIDFSYEKLMSYKELCKLAGQIRRLYGSNLKFLKPFHICLTSVSIDSPLLAVCRQQNDGFDNYLLDIEQKSPLDLFGRGDIVYLSPDAKTVLTDIDPNSVYVIGGLVDHQILRETTTSSAESSSVRTARLPIDEYMEFSTGKRHTNKRVLAVNQVVDILLKYVETSDWQVALSHGVPKRTGLVLKHVEAGLQ